MITDIPVRITNTDKKSPIDISGVIETSDKPFDSRPKDDFFTKAANLARKAWNCNAIAWTLVLGLLVSLFLSRMELVDYKNALRSCGMKLEVIEKAYNVTE